jgi:hypothetical protein
MDLEEFEDLVDRWGEDIHRWQSPFREQAAELLRTNGSARDVLDQAAFLRRTIAGPAPAKAPAGLADRITAAAKRETMSRRRPPAFRAWFEFTGDLRPMRSAVLLSLCFLMGAGAGLLSFPIQGNADQVDFLTLLVRAVN